VSPSALGAYIWQEPGGPPQRPQAGVSAEGDLPDSELTAKTLSARDVSAEPHRGHLAFDFDDRPLPALIERTSCSNLELQELQVYS
jgi:hypothetical protein